MKRVLSLILTCLISTSVFALEFNIREGFSYADIGVSVTEDMVYTAGCPLRPSNFTEIELSDKYFDVTLRTVDNDRQITLDTTGQVNYDFGNIITYLEVNYSYVNCHDILTKATWNYLDTVVGAELYIEKNWFKASGFVEAGWCFIDANKADALGNYYTGSHYCDRNNVTTTTLGISAEFFNIVEVYASMQSYQIPRLPTMIPTSVNNVIGIKAHYNFTKHWGIFGEASHYCKHPETPAYNSKYDTFADNAGTTIVLGVQFSL